MIVATEQLGLYVHMMAFQHHRVMPGMIADPPSLGDWLNLAQFAAVWLGHFALCVVLTLPAGLANI